MTSPDGAARASLTRRWLLRAGATTGAALLAGPATPGSRAGAATPARRMRVLRTPQHRFDALDGFPFRPRYVGVGTGDRLRLHYIDARPDPACASGETVLLLHGEPSWSYVYRHLIEPLTAAGHRCVAPDLIGFGRSDKPARRADHTYQRQVDWLREAVFGRLGLRGITMVCHDWGGLLGLRLLAEHPHRFRRAVASNTFLPTGDEDLGDAFRAWREYSQRVQPFDSGLIVDAGTLTDLDPAIRAAYTAPFPDESYLAAARQFPMLVPTTPDDPAAEPNRRAWRVLQRLHTPFLCAFSDRDWGIGGGPAPLHDRIPGARGVRHVTIADAGHFVQEDQAHAMAEVINTFLAG